MSRRSVHKLNRVSQDLLDHAALLGAFVTGTAGVVLLKMLQAGPWIAVLYPVFVLACYALVCLASGRLTLEPEIIGDNCYYLGFLFTLASLATSLHQMHAITGVSGAEQLIPTVISGFGIALSSTIAGVFLRVMLMQMRPDLVALDREARRDMQAVMRDMRADIATASREFRAMAIEAAQRAAEREAAFAEEAPTGRSTSLVAELLAIEAQRAKREAALLEAIKKLHHKSGASEPPRVLQGVGR